MVAIGAVCFCASALVDALFILRRNSMKKRLPLLIVAIVTVVAVVIAIFVFVGKKPSQDNPIIVYTPSEGLEFKLNEDGKSYTVIGIGECRDDEIVIPNTYENLPVNGIGEYTFAEFSGSIVIPESIDIIDKRAFTKGYYTINLSKITVDENNKYYKSIDGILYSKDGKTLIRYTNYNYEKSFTVPDFVTNIDSWAFAFTYLENIYFLGSVENIGEYAFAYTNIRNIDISDSVTSIADSVFSNCYSLKTVNIPDSVKSIGDHAFSDCNSLKTVNIPDSVKSIGDYAFSNCNSLKTINIPDSVKSIGDHAFLNCDSLESVEIPNSITYVGRNAFESCNSLTFYRYGGCYYLGNSENPFYALVEKVYEEEHPTVHKDTCVVATRVLGNSCSIKVDEDNQYFKSIDIDLYSKDEKTLIQCAGQSYGIRLLNIPNTVEYIYEYAFYESDVYRIYIPSSVVDIGSTYIRDDYYCERYGINIDVDKDNQYYQSIDGNLYTKDGKTLLRYNPKNNNTSFVIPDFVENIGECAFYGCDSLESIIIPKSVLNIGEYAFSGCDSLESVIIPDSVVNIGCYAFAYLNKLTIYCEAESQPSGWHKDWCLNYDHKTPVIWGYTGN